jgi:hypothetical protein
MKPTRDQILRYVADRFSGQHVTARKQLMLRCPFHADSSASLSFNTEEGVWKCFTGCGEGGLIDFEHKLNGGSREEARARMEEVMGAEHLFVGGLKKIVAVYKYVDVQGNLVFEKVRYDPKDFKCRIQLPNGGYQMHLNSTTEKPLYRLPQVMRAGVIIVVEGEKDADRVMTLGLQDVAATTAEAGTSVWRDEDSAYFKGKKVVVLPDNDEGGKRHAERIAESAMKHGAAGVKLIELPGLGPKGDISDWLDAGHTVEEFVQLVKTTPHWRAKEAEYVLTVDGAEFAAQAPERIDWLLDQIIQKGGNGIIAGTQKAGKSLAAIYLLLSLMTGTPWFGFRVPRRIKCGLVSREDHPSLTAQRLAQLWRGGDWRDHYHGWLRLNTRKQTPTFLLNDDATVSQLIAEYQRAEVEFAVFDVFRKLHHADENDNSEMQKILEVLNRFQAEVGCAVALVHHISKHYEGSVFRNIRGAGAIDGWTEWAMGITITNPGEKSSRKFIRECQFETKAAESADPICFRVESGLDTMRLVLTDGPKDDSNFSMAQLLTERG